MRKPLLVQEQSALLTLDGILQLITLLLLQVMR